MRTIWWMAAAAAAVLGGVSPAAAQRVWQDGRWSALPPRQGPMPPAPPQMQPPRPATPPAYRAPMRGGMLPPMWVGQRYRLPNFGHWGLPTPPFGFFWVRYYDDAVMVDGRGRVRDSRRGIDWNRGGAGAWAQSESHSNVTVYGRQDSHGTIRPIDPNDGYYGTGSQNWGADYADEESATCDCDHADSGWSASNGQGSGYSVYPGQPGGYWYGGPVTTTIVIQQAPATITTTTTTIEEEVIEESGGTVYEAPQKRVKRVYRTPQKVVPR